MRVRGTDLVLQGDAHRVTEASTLERLAAVFRTCGWPVTADSDAPTAPVQRAERGPGAWHLCRLAVHIAVGVATAEMPLNVDRLSYRNGRPFRSTAPVGYLLMPNRLDGTCVTCVTPYFGHPNAPRSGFDAERNGISGDRRNRGPIGCDSEQRVVARRTPRCVIKSCRLFWLVAPTGYAESCPPRGAPPVYNQGQEWGTHCWHRKRGALG